MGKYLHHFKTEEEYQSYLENDYVEPFVSASPYSGSGGTLVTFNNDTNVSFDRVIPNPKLVGNEESLDGIQIGETKYKIDGGGGSTPYELQDFQLDLTEEEFECSDADAEYIFTNNPVAISLGGTIAVARDFTNDESKSDYSRSYTIFEFPDDDQIIYYELGLYWDGSEYSSDVKPTDPIGGGGSTDVQINGTSIVSSDVANIITETAYDASTNKIATMADVPVISNPLAGKKVSLIGDSITTWSSVKPDNTYLSRYPTGVIQSMDQTWWDQMITNGGMTLLRNTAYNGSSCTGRDGGSGHNTSSTTDAYAACSDKRINDLSDGTSNPDIVICFIGINDFGSDKNTPTGNYIGLDVIPSDSATGMATFSEGYALMLKKIATKYPAARIYCCTLPSVGYGSVSDMYTARWFGSSFPVYNTTTHAYLADYNNTIRTLAHNMGAGIIEFAECINWFNSATLLEDGLHPNIAGMKLLGDKALAKLQSDFAVVTEQ